MKVYVVIDEFVNDLDRGIDVIGVYKTFEMAQKKLKEDKEQIEAVTNYNVKEDTDDGWTGYMDGEYDISHTNIFIQERELQ